jgi:1,4-alpha-glucan branching enzyme
VLPLSHDEVVHGKRSLIEKMHGDEWQRFANLRLLYAYMWAQPGESCCSGGGSVSCPSGRTTAASTRHPAGRVAFHAADGVRRRAELAVSRPRALYIHDVGLSGFEWVDADDNENSVFVFLRKGTSPEEVVLCVFNCTPVPRHDYRIGVPVGGRWRELLNSDAAAFGGSGAGNLGGVTADGAAFHGRPASLRLTLPPLAAVWLTPEV